MELVPSKPTEHDSRLIWGRKTMDLGFNQLPSLLFQRQKELGLEALDMNIILQIASFWWKKDRMPYPSKRFLADSISVSQSTIQRRIAALEKRGYVKRIVQSASSKARKANVYDLSGLVAALSLQADKEQIEREAKKTKKGRRTLAPAPQPAIAKVQAV